MVAVIAVIAAIAAPGMRSFAATQRVKSLAYDLTADLLLARSEALKRNTSVTIAKTGSTWGSGWAVASGADNISTRNAIDAALTFGSAPTSITFDVNGRSAAQVRMSVSSPDATSDTSKRCIELDLSGRAKSKVGLCP